MKTPSRLGIGGPFRRLSRLDAGLRGAEPRDRDHERRARHVRHAHLVAELDRRGLAAVLTADADLEVGPRPDRKSTRLNSSHSQISYAVFCLKKKKKLTYNNLLSE